MYMLLHIVYSVEWCPVLYSYYLYLLFQIHVTGKKLFRKMIWQKQYQLAVYDDEKQDTLTTFFSQSFAWKNPGFWRTVVIKYQQKQGRFLPGCLSPCIENHYQQESPLKMQYSTMAYSRVTTTIVNLKHLLFFTVRGSLFILWWGTSSLQEAL